MNESMQSENSSKANEFNRGKMESLYKAFNDLNWDKQKNLSSEDIIFFLNTNSPKGKFDEVLSQNLLKYLGFENIDSITVEEFIQYYMKFDSEMQKNKEDFNNKLIVRQNSLNNLEEQCNKYKNEELDSEGFCQDAKLSLEISGIDIKTDLGDVNVINIIIEIIHNGQKYEKYFDPNDDDNNYNKKFELKPQKQTDTLIVCLKCVIDNNDVIEIGKREFPINQITTQEECEAQISIPEENNDAIEAAIISTKINFLWSYYEKFSDKKKETEQKIEQIKKVISETDKYCTEINNIYLKNMKIQNQPNVNNIQWNDNIMKPNNDGPKPTYIDIENNNNLNENEYNEEMKKNLFEMNSNDNFRISTQSPKEIKILKIIGFSLICLGLLNGIHKNEFPNELCGILIFLSCYDIFQGNIGKSRFLNKFNFYYCLALLALDIIWIFSYFTEEYDEINGIGPTIVTKLLVGLNIIIKRFGSVILHKKIKL